MAPGEHPVLDTDLVEYLVIAVQDVALLEGVAAALAESDEAGSIRVLDLVVMARDGHTGALEVLEVENVAGASGWGALADRADGLLSEHDINLVGSALAPDEAALLVLIESRWAERVSRAALQSGGRVVGGERILTEHADAALATAAERSRQLASGRGRAPRADVQGSRSDGPDLLTRPPAMRSPDTHSVPGIIDPVQQLRELSQLLADGFLSLEDFERQRRKVLGT